MHSTFLLLLALAGGPTTGSTDVNSDKPTVMEEAATLTTGVRAIISGDETVMIGQMAELSAEDSVNAKTYQWILRPKPLSMKKVNKLGSVLHVSHNTAQVFEVQLTIASPDGQLDTQIGMLEVAGPETAQDQVMVEPTQPHAQLGSPNMTVPELVVALKQLKELQELLNPAPPVIAPQQVAMVAPGMTTAAMMGAPAHPANTVSWPDGIKRMAEQVRSNTRREEGRIIAGSLRSVASRIKTGTFVGQDPWTEAIKQSKEGLGNAWPVWGTFFTDLGKFVGTMRQQGIQPTIESCVPFLESAAQSLGSL